MSSEKQNDSQKQIADTLSFLAEQFVAVAGKEKGNQPLPPKKEDPIEDEEDDDYDEDDEDYSLDDEDDDEDEEDDDITDEQIFKNLCKIIKKHKHVLSDCPFLLKQLAGKPKTSVKK